MYTNPKCGSLSILISVSVIDSIEFIAMSPIYFNFLNYN